MSTLRKRTSISVHMENSRSKKKSEEDASTEVLRQLSLIPGGPEAPLSSEKPFMRPLIKLMNCWEAIQARKSIWSQEQGENKYEFLWDLLSNGSGRWSNAVCVPSCIPQPTSDYSDILTDSSTYSDSIPSPVYLLRLCFSTAMISLKLQKAT